MNIIWRCRSSVYVTDCSTMHPDVHSSIWLWPFVIPVVGLISVDQKSDSESYHVYSLLQGST